MPLCIRQQLIAPAALAAWIKFPYSVKTAGTMTAVMGAAFLYFLLAQNRWSWHLIGRRQQELEVGSDGTGNQILTCIVRQPACMCVVLCRRPCHSRRLP